MNLETKQDHLREGELPADFEARVHAAAQPMETPSGNGRMVWRAWGSSQRPALVLFHGGFGSWRHWILNVLQLSEKYRVIAADLPGLGDSDPISEEYTAENIAATVSAGVDQIVPPPERFHIAGFSFGGIIGGHVSAIQGRRVKSYTAVAAGGLGLRNAKYPELASMSAAVTPKALIEVHRTNLSRLMISKPDRIDDLAIHVQTETVRRARVRSGKIPWTGTLTSALKRIDTTLAGIWGEKDVIAAPYMNDRIELFQSIQPGCEFRVIEDAGHWVMYERPDAFNTTLLELLESAEKC
jgi:2-hydroxy-6-oxonona-2,4-dienedioate hydrolase